MGGSMCKWELCEVVCEFELGVECNGYGRGGGELNDVVDDEATADESGVAFVPPYTLEVGSRGISNELTRDADYVVYKGFQVTLTTSSEFKGRPVFDDVSLHGRDEKAVTLNSKGRLIAVPRELVESVCLKQLDLEDGDEIVVDLSMLDVPRSVRVHELEDSVDLCDYEDDWVFQWNIFIGFMKIINSRLR